MRLSLLFKVIGKTFVIQWSSHDRQFKTNECKS